MPREVWIRNEWIERNGRLVQEGSCLRNSVDPIKDTILDTWEHMQWIYIGDSLILGLPADPAKYFVVSFHKEVR